MKGESELVAEVVAETRGFEADQNAYDVACQQDIEDLQKQQAEFERMIEKFRNSRYAHTEDVNGILKKIEGKKKNVV